MWLLQHQTSHFQPDLSKLRKCRDFVSFQRKIHWNVSLILIYLIRKWSHPGNEIVLDTWTKPRIPENRDCPDEVGKALHSESSETLHYVWHYIHTGLLMALKHSLALWPFESLEITHLRTFSQTFPFFRIFFLFFKRICWLFAREWPRTVSGTSSIRRLPILL